MDRDLPRLGEVWRHFKNKNCKIINIAIHTETKEKLVVYRAMYDNMSIYAMPLDMFMSEIDHEQYSEVV